MLHVWQRNSVVLLVGVALALGTRLACAQGVYRQAEIDSAGRLRIVLSNNRVIWPPRDSQQVGFEKAAISADHRVVGWLALYPNCCTSYPVPLKLVLRHADGRRTVISNELPIWQWAFAADGRSVVIRQAPVHGDAPTSYELREIHTGRLVATIQKDSTTNLPVWARVVRPRSDSSPPFSNKR